MAQIAEDLLLLLLDNASRNPALERHRCDRVLAGAVLLDLAFACRIRPAVPGEPVEAGRLVALAGDGPLDPVVGPAFQLLQQRPLRPSGAVSKLRKNAREHISLHLERMGQLRHIPVSAKRFSDIAAWPLIDRARVAQARAALLSALFDRRPPTPSTAAIVSLLHAVDGLGALLSLNDRGWRWVHARATEISSGSWINEYPTALPEMNLAVTASALRPALT
jgi:Golgi phosphoprotein 3 (GPP34)